MTGESPFSNIETANDFLVHCAATDKDVRIVARSRPYDRAYMGNLLHEIAIRFEIEPEGVTRAVDIARAEIERHRNHG
jgi:hypothetical protein